MKILVLGGYGYFGSQLLSILRKHAPDDVRPGARSRRGEETVVVDWQSPDSVRAALEEFDTIINAAPWPPADRLQPILQAAILQGKCWIETTADPKQTKKLLAWKHQAPVGPGTVVIGAGIFPGMSNLLVDSFSSKNGLRRLAIRYNLLSGAGPGMCRLMAETLTTPAVYLEEGLQKEGSPVGPTVVFPWSDGPHPAMRVYLADAEYLFLREGITDAATYLSLRPNFLHYLSAPANWLPRGPATVGLLTGYFRLLRGAVFGNNRTAIEFCVSDGKTSKRLVASDAFYAGGLLLAACLARLHTHPAAGFLSIEDVMTLDDLLLFSGKYDVILEVSDEG